jgi:hypothetical protein
LVGGFAATGRVPNVERPSKRAPSKSAQGGNSSLPPMAKPGRYGELMRATAAIWASERHVSPPSLPSGQRSVLFTVSMLNLLLQATTLPMMPSRSPSSASQALNTASVRSRVFAALIQPAPPFSYTALPTLSEPRCSMVTL